MGQEIAIALFSFAGGIVATLAGFVGKYLFDYKIAKRKFELEKKVTERRLELEERTSVSTVLGSSQANFARATGDLYARLSNFFEAPHRTRNWLQPAATPAEDGYYLREFCRRLFYFITWGRVTQDAINALPIGVVEERPDLQRTYVFVNLANSLLTYTWLFRGLENYRDEDENFHLFTGTLERIAQSGVRLWKEGEQSIPLDSFAKRYDEGAPMVVLRDFLSQVDEKSSDESANAAGIIVARLATLHVVLAGFLARNYSWVIDVPEEWEIVEAYKRNLTYAASITEHDLPFPELVPENLAELMDRYKSKPLSLELS
jgi:hypothetical protein